MQRVIHPNGVITYTFDILADYPVSVHISTRHGGVSPSPWNTLNFSVKRGDSRERVDENRQRLADALSVEASSIVSCQQIHGCSIVTVGREAAGALHNDADGMVTDTTMLPLSLVFADCVPVVLYDVYRNVLGVCHAGWRGTVQGVAAATLTAMIEQFGTEPGDVRAGVGPSIGPASYEVGDEVIQAAFAQLPYAERLFVYRNGDGQNPHFDLWKTNKTQLVNAGVPAAQIEVSGIDTATNTHDFFSHRGERGQCGLFSMVSWLHETPAAQT